MNGFTELNQMLSVVSNELGKVVDFEEECPGVYYIVTINAAESRLRQPGPVPPVYPADWPASLP